MRSFVWGLIFIALGAAATTLIGRGRVTFDKSAQTATFETIGFLFVPRNHVVPLSEVSHATIQTTAGASMFVVVFVAARDEV